MRKITHPKWKLDDVPKNSLLTFQKQTVFYGVINGKEVSPKAVYSCKCGGSIEAMIGNVRTGKTLSCGCYRYTSPNMKKHGFSTHPLYTVWENMLTRCYNPKVKEYIRYGGRGVKMCKEWKESPESFIKWGLANGWEKGLHLDKDIKGTGLLYSPDTCLFVTPQENNNHTRRSRYFEYNGKIQTMAQWAKEYGFQLPTLFYRLKKHSIGDALNMPKRVW
jgi:hypothetical protein